MPKEVGKEDRFPCENPRLAGETFSGVSLERADLRHAWIEECVFRDVCFDRADLSYATDHGSLFERCSFKSTNFERAMFGHRGTRLIDCSFIRARFRGADFIRPEFDRCEFVCNFKNIDFNASSFVDCRFEGKLQDVWFHGGFGLPDFEDDFGKPRKNEMKNVDFSAAELRQMTYSDDCDLSTVVLPAKGRYRRYDRWRQRLERAVERIQSWKGNDEKRARDFVEVALIHARTQPWYIMNTDELAEDYGAELADRIVAALED